MISVDVSGGTMSLVYRRCKSCECKCYVTHIEESRIAQGSVTIHELYDRRRILHELGLRTDFVESHREQVKNEILNHPWGPKA